MFHFVAIPFVSFQFSSIPANKLKKDSTFTLTRISGAENSEECSCKWQYRNVIWRTNVLHSICLFDKDLSTQHTLWINKSWSRHAPASEKNSWTANLHLCSCYFAFAISFFIYLCLVAFSRKKMLEFLFLFAETIPSGVYRLNCDRLNGYFFWQWNILLVTIIK